MSEVQHQLLITLVHGTWPRGFFPRLFRFKQWIRELIGWRQPGEPPPFWFEEGSSFFTRLTTELGGISHKIRLLPWTGGNSIFERDQAAHDLAKHLSTEHADQPQATQLIIAHSHGGNIALRALRHLQERDAFGSCRTDCANLLVVTLATPFIEVHKADFGFRPDQVRWALVTFLLLPLYVLGISAPLYFLTPLSNPALAFITQMLSGAIFLASAWYLIDFRKKARQGSLDKLRTATRLGELLSAQ